MVMPSASATQCAFPRVPAGTSPFMGTRSLLPVTRDRPGPPRGMCALCLPKGPTAWRSARRVARYFDCHVSRGCRENSTEVIPTDQRLAVAGIIRWQVRAERGRGSTVLGSTPVSVASVLVAVDRGWGAVAAGRQTGGAGEGLSRGWGALVLVRAERVQVFLQALRPLLPCLRVGEVGEDARPGGAGFPFWVHRGRRHTSRPPPTPSSRTTGPPTTTSRPIKSPTPPKCSPSSKHVPTGTPGTTR